MTEAIVRELIAVFGFKVDEASKAKVESAVSGVTRLAQAAISTWGALKVGGFVAAAVEEVTRLGDALDEMSTRTGIAAEELQTLGYVAELSGVSMGSMEQSVKLLQVSMTQAATGAGDDAKAFARLGVQVKNANGTLKSADEIMPQIADGFARIESATERTALAQKLFGRTGTQLLPVLTGGSEALKAQQKELEDLGAVMDEALLKSSVRYRDNAVRVSKGLLGIKYQIARGIVPWLIRAQEGTINFIKSIQAAFGPRIQAFFSSVGQLIYSIGSAIGWVAKTILGWWQAMTPVQKAFAKIGLIAAGIAALLALPGGALLLLIGLIALLIDDFVVWRKGGESAIGNLIAALNDLLGLDIVGGFKRIWKIVKGTLDSIANAIFAIGKFWYDLFDVGLVKALRNFFDSCSWIFDGLLEAWEDVTEAIGTAWDNFWRGPVETIKGFVEELSNLPRRLKEWLTSGIFSISDMLSLESARRAIEDFKGWISGLAGSLWTPLIQGTKDFLSSIWDTIYSGGEKLVTYFLGLARRLLEPFTFVRRTLESMGILTPKAEITGALAKMAGPGGQTSSNVLTAAPSRTTVSVMPETTIDVTVNAAPGQSAQAVGTEVTSKVKDAFDQIFKDSMQSIWTGPPQTAGGG